MFERRMYSFIRPEKSYADSVNELRKAIDEADAVVIGAGAGLSTSAGYEYGGKRFKMYFSDLENKYGYHDMYSGGFYPFETLEEYWAHWSRHIYVNRYMDPPKNTYELLHNLVRNKDYFVITTNVDHCFQRAGFDKERLFYTQGDYGLFQCSTPCHNETYDNEEIVMKMIQEQKDMKVPSSLIPHCPKCGQPMTMNLRADNTFVEDSGWHKAKDRYYSFLEAHDGKKVLYLDLGIGANTPVIIKYPFFRFTEANKNATYASINYGEAFCIDTIKDQSILIESDIHKVLTDLESGD